MQPIRLEVEEMKQPLMTFPNLSVAQSQVTSTVVLADLVREFLFFVVQQTSNPPSGQMLH